MKTMTAGQRCCAIVRLDSQSFGRLRWEVRSDPITNDHWDGNLWNLVELLRRGIPGERYRAEGYKPSDPTMPVVTYEIVLPSEAHPDGKVFRETIRTIRGGLTAFDFVEVS
jgi:hypothetical protein